MVKETQPESSKNDTPKGVQRNNHKKISPLIQFVYKDTAFYKSIF